jgi:hypothetical protein
LNLSNVDLIIAKKPTIKIEISIQLADLSYEWIPMGTFVLTEWKNDIGALTVIMTGRDSFDYLSTVTYENLVSDTLYNLAIDIINSAGIASYSIDSSLQLLSGAFDKSYDSRQALQLIAIASQCILYQDRLGAVTIKPLSKTAVNFAYYTYAGGPQMYAGSITPYVNNGYDVKSITYANVYYEPRVRLDKQIYSVTINGANIINSLVASGKSLSISNPLIPEGSEVAIASWMFSESAKTAIYETQWRQNPALECGDVVLIQDSFNAKKQTIITRQEFNYSGYLSGKTNTNGGI